MLTVALLVLTFGIYHYASPAVPYADQLAIMSERGIVSSDWKFFVNSLSFNRTRQFSPGDYYLFRPAMTGLLAVEDILFRHNLYILGALSIFWHCLCVLALYFLIGPFIRGSPKWILLSFFLVQYSGIDMIFFRHVSPYLFGICFFAIGTYLLKEPLSSSRRWVCALCFFVSMLFTELTALSLLLSGTLVCLKWKWKTPAKKLPFGFSITDVGSIFFLPAMGYAALSLLDSWYYHAPFQLFGPGEPGWHLNPIHVFNDLIMINGAFFTAFAFPFLVSFAPINPTSRLLWNFNAVGDPLLFLGGCFLVACFCWSLMRFFEKDRQETERVRVLLPLLCQLVVAIFGISLIRVSQREWSYLKISTYYFYISNFFLAAIVAVLWEPFRKWCHARRWGKRALQVLGFAASLAVLVSLVRIQLTLKDSQKTRNQLATLTLNAAKTLIANPRYCYGGTRYDWVLGEVLELNLYRQSCRVRRGTPVYSIQDAYGDIWLARYDMANSPHTHSLWQIGKGS